jgi:hypothetical protein
MRIIIVAYFLLAMINSVAGSKNVVRPGTDRGIATRELPDSSVTHRFFPANNRDPSTVEPEPLECCQPDPPYADAAKAGWTNATIMVDVKVGADGLLAKWQIMPLDTVSPGVQRVIGDAITRWKFAPRTRNGEPVSGWATVIFTAKPPRERIKTPSELWVSTVDTASANLLGGIGDTASLCNAELSLMGDNQVQIYKRQQRDFLQVKIQGLLRPQHLAKEPRETAYHFIDDYRAVFGICNPRQEVRYVRDSPWALDSARKAFHGRQMNRFCFIQFFDDHPVVNSFISVDMLCDSLTITNVSAQIVLDPGVTATARITSDQALETVHPFLEGPDRHCQATDPILAEVQDGCCTRLVWRVGLSCGPDLGFHWGEEAWIDATSGELLKSFHTWIE